MGVICHCNRKQEDEMDYEITSKIKEKVKAKSKLDKINHRTASLNNTPKINALEIVEDINDVSITSNAESN